MRLCRVGGECWDVTLRFSDPENGHRAPRVFRHAVDVSDVLPVTVREVRAWPEDLTHD